MRGDVFAWAAIALLLFAAEALAPGAFMLWLGLAAGVVFLAVLFAPGMPILVQVGAFVVLSFVSVQFYRRRFRDRATRSDQPMLNQRAAALVGRVVPLEQGIVNGRGRVQIADAYWDVSGPDLPSGAVVRIVAAHGMTLEVREA